ncbi:hypothetical protein C2845_PM08G29250 [Panicum miliaceum]|uniref:Uncharacterized protein n=1 Tax=Panicum miliaceum TaxID=4540 RepID=A0A3L6QXW3_PANMI|nr:hypothetical protein C2845_PM08G29250 [Panicum miliaceum]
MEKAVKNKVAKAVVPAIDVMFQALRKKELEAELANVSGIAKPTRKIRSEQERELEEEAVAETTGANTSEEAVADVPVEIDEYDLVDPIDILTPLEKSGFWDGVKATEWSERRDAVAELTNLASAEKIAPADFHEICRTLKKLITDVNLAVSVEATQCLNDGTPEVRDASFSVLTAIAKIVGMKPLERSLEKLDDVRKKKLSDMIGSVRDTALSSGTAPSTTSGAATSARGAADSLSMKRSAASMLSGKKPVQAEAATKKSGRSKSTAAKKTDGGSQSKTSAAPEIEDIERVAATGDRAAFTFSIPKSESMDETQETHTVSTFPSNHEKGAIPRPYLSQGALTTAQLSNDFHNLQQIGKIVDLVRKAMPLALTPENDPGKEELKQLQAQLEDINKLAHKQVRRILWSGLGFLITQVGLFFRLTFWEFSWDVMEPITFFTTTTGLVVGYAYFLITARDPTYRDFMERMFESRQRKLI